MMLPSGEISNQPDEERNVMRLLADSNRPASDQETTGRYSRQGEEVTASLTKKKERDDGSRCQEQEPSPQLNQAANRTTRLAKAAVASKTTGRMEERN
jgi:hypothetical protein